MARIIRPLCTAAPNVSKNPFQKHVQVSAYHLSAVEGRANRSEADVGESNSRIRVRSLQLRVGTVIRRARTTLSTPSRLALRVSRIKPQHVGVSISPQRERKNHALLKRLAHMRHTANLRELILLLTESLLLGRAELVGERAAGVAGHDALGVSDDLAVLDVDALDLGEEAVIAGDELGHDGDGLGAVDGEAGALAVELLVALAEGVEVAAVCVAGAAVAVVGEGSAALVAGAGVVAVVDAGVGSVRGGGVVGLWLGESVCCLEYETRR